MIVSRCFLIATLVGGGCFFYYEHLASEVLAGEQIYLKKEEMMDDVLNLLKLSKYATPEEFRRAVRPAKEKFDAFYAFVLTDEKLPAVQPASPSPSTTTPELPAALPVAHPHPETLMSNGGETDVPSEQPVPTDMPTTESLESPSTDMPTTESLEPSAEPLAEGAPTPSEPLSNGMDMEAMYAQDVAPAAQEESLPEGAS
jgi:hypothetical protein